MSTTLLLDADILAFKIASTSQKSFQFDPDCEPSIAVDDWDQVTPRVDTMIADLQARLGTQDVVVCLSCPTAENWRLDILPTYKGQRDYSKRPVHLAAIKDYMEANWPSYRRPTLEADDIMGILSTSRSGRNIIVSEDKDMRTVPGWLFNPAKHIRPMLISEADADWFHLYQAIVGDTVDNYDGCPGAGPTSAEELFAFPCLWESWEHVFSRGPRKGLSETRWGRIAGIRPSPWEAIVSLYERHGRTREDALVQARVARICRASDFDFNTKKVIPWTPH